MKTGSLVTLGILLILGIAPASGQDWCYNADNIYTMVYGSTVVIHHDAALYNCCPDGFDYSIDQVGDTFYVDEIEILNNPCYCICCFNLAATIEDVAPGEYNMIFSWYDYEIYEWVQEQLHFSVPALGQTGASALGDIYWSGCLDSPTSASEPTEEPALWGTIKSLFR
jgi:hypothetical protein